MSPSISNSVSKHLYCVDRGDYQRICFSLFRAKEIASTWWRMNRSDVKIYVYDLKGCIENESCRNEKV